MPFQVCGPVCPGGPVTPENESTSYQSLLAKLVSISQELQARYELEGLRDVLDSQTTTAVAVLSPPVPAVKVAGVAPAKAASSVVIQDQSSLAEEVKYTSMDGEDSFDLMTRNQSRQLTREQSEQSGSRCEKSISRVLTNYQEYSRSHAYDEAQTQVDKNGNKEDDEPGERANVFKHGNSRKLTKHFRDADCASNERIGISRNAFHFPTWECGHLTLMSCLFGISWLAELLSLTRSFSLLKSSTLDMGRSMHSSHG
jgi:hypothetical protein